MITHGYEVKREQEDHDETEAFVNWAWPKAVTLLCSTGSHAPTAIIVKEKIIQVLDIEEINKQKDRSYLNKLIEELVSDGSAALVCIISEDDKVLTMEIEDKQGQQLVRRATFNREGLSVTAVNPPIDTGHLIDNGLLQNHF